MSDTPEIKPVHPMRLAMNQVWQWRLANASEMTAENVGRSMALIPLSALLLGLLLATIAWLFSGFQAEISAALVLIVWAKLSGASTLDSLAQIADAALSKEPEALQQLKSSNRLALGSMGIIVLVLTLILKWSLLVTLIRAEWWTVIVLMPMVGWVFAQMVMTGSRWVNRHDSLPEGWREKVELSWLWPQWLLLLMALALASGWTLTLLILSTWIYIVWWRKKVGGINYVISLAWVELSELLWLIGLVWLLLPS